QVTDAVITKCDVKMIGNLNVLNKASPGPNPIIFGALFTYPKTGQLNRSWGQLTPAWAAAKLSGSKVNTSDSEVQAYYHLWAQTNITNLTSFLSNNWEGLQPAKRVKRNDRSHEREYNRNSIENSLP